MNRLKDKVALITGGGSGIGKAMAQRFANEGAWVHVLDLDTDAGRKVADEIGESGGRGEFAQVDVASPESVQAAIDSIERIDILVNNAAVSSIGNVEAITSEEMDRVYRINVKGVYYCLHAIVPRMKEQGRGVILNMASIVSKLGIHDRFAYSMSKGAVLSMTLSVARDYVRHGIRCNCICPARIRTPLLEGFVDEHYSDRREEYLSELSEYQPIGRMGEPKEIAALAAFLCSDDASFITGSAYDIDGGVTLLR